MSLVRVTNFSISLDGYGAGEPQSLEAPFGHAGEQLHEWSSPRWQPGAARRRRRRLRPAVRRRLRRRDHGRQQVRPARLAGRPRLARAGGARTRPSTRRPTSSRTGRAPSMEMEGGTTFHFLDASPAEALAVAKEAAGDLDVRIGGGATGDPRLRRRRASSTTCTSPSYRSSSAAAPGSGTGLEALEDTFDIEAVSSPSGVTHLSLTRKAAPDPDAAAGRRGDFGRPSPLRYARPRCPAGVSGWAAGCGAAW